MKRKVIRLAGKTLIVSLPNKWVKKYGIKKGDEVDVDEEERKLIIKAGGKGESTTKTLDSKELDLMLSRVIGGLYKAGYDEIEVTYYTPEQYCIIRDVLNKTCVGYEIIRHGQRTILIRNLSELHAQELDNIMRRLFLTLLSSSEDALAYINQGNLKGMEEIILRDQLINKYSDLCRRILNIQGHESTKKTTTVYHISEELEKIGDGYRDLMLLITNNKMTKFNKETTDLMQAINSLLRNFYELFYQFNLKKLEYFGELSNEIKCKFSNRFENTPSKDLKLYYCLYRIFSTIYDMNGSVITANI